MHKFVNRLKGPSREMKRTTLTIAILAISLLSVVGNRRTLAHFDNSLIHSAAGAGMSQEQTLTQGGMLTEEFHQNYPLSATGRVSIENINGGVRIAVWDQNEVKVDAVKRSHQREGLDEVKIEVVNTADSVRIKTRYPDREQSFNDQGSRRYNNPASVEYTLTIPRKAQLDSAQLVNGSLDIEGVEGDVKADCVNGRIKANGLMGEVRLSTVNGGIEATILRLDDARGVTLNSVNGTIDLIIPGNASAQIKANTIHGAITNDFGLQVNDGQYVGHDLSGQIGSGGPRVRLNNVNGPISIKRG
jgi:DUF4097 and DUF4098 domain-containing protein YvlB